MASRLGDLEEWKDREQDYKDEIDLLKSSLSFLTHQSDQREVQLTAKLDSNIARAQRMEQNFVKLQEETDMQCGELRDERDLAKVEFQRVVEANGDQKIKHKKELEKAMSSRSEEVDTLEGQLLSLQEHVKRMEGEKHKNEKLTAQMKRDLENQLREVCQRSAQEIERLKSRLGAQDQQRKHDMLDWQRDRHSLEGAIADTARLSDELISLKQQLTHFRTQAEGYKTKFQEERTRIRQLEHDMQLTQEILKKKEQEHKDEVRYRTSPCSPYTIKPGLPMATI